MKKNIYKLLEILVVISFLYLILFENVYDINRIIMNNFSCKLEEVIYFKIAIIFIIVLIIEIIKIKLNKPENLYCFCYASIQEYISIHPLRSLIALIIILIAGLMVSYIFLTKSVLSYLLFIILTIFSTCLGFSIGVLKRNKK